MIADLWKQLANRLYLGMILLKIAVIDDEKGILMATSIFLEMEGHQPYTFSSPIQALDTLTKIKVDVIILDLRMPEMNGEQLAYKLKSLPETRDIPIILCSANDTAAEIAERIGAQGVLEKPFQFSELIELISPFDNES